MKQTFSFGYWKMIMFDVVSHKNISFKTYNTIFFGVFLISVIMFMSSISNSEEPSADGPKYPSTVV